MQRIAQFLFDGLLFIILTNSLAAEELKQVRYNNPGLVVDLGVGLWAWPLPMDYDGDGDYDLVVSCPDKPSNGTYFFENVEGPTRLPTFRPGVRIGAGFRNIQISYVGDSVRVLTPATEFMDFRSRQFSRPRKLGLPANIHIAGRKIRANQWKLVDFDGDGVLDLSVAVGDWTDYGWDDAYNQRGEWTRGPLRGFVYIVRNAGSSNQPRYEKPQQIMVGHAGLEVFGWPSPNFIDVDGDEDLDLICGEFLDRLTCFINVGTRTKPIYSAGRRLQTSRGDLTMDLQMIVPVACDWDQDGDNDLIVGDEDGRVAFVENTGRLDQGLPIFHAPRYFRQQADALKFGALATPYAYDWDGDGDQDLLCGNTAGYIGWFENLDGSPQPRWAAPRLLEADGQVIRIQAGRNGSIQGPCEAKWGYTTLNVADWDHDGLPDLIVNSIWGAVSWYRNLGDRHHPRLAARSNITVQWNGPPPKPSWVWWHPQDGQLVTQWRTTPVVKDWTQDGLNDLVMLDHEGYLALFTRFRTRSGLALKPGQRLFADESGKLLRLNSRSAGGSGRRKLELVDWDGDGQLDLLTNGAQGRTDIKIFKNIFFKLLKM
ncbi:MAG: VCBS repeat-containing protein [Planctomycetaceae bacterium]